MSDHRTCRVCEQPLSEPIYRSATEISLTSLCEIRRERTIVHFCPHCGHLQTAALADLGEYYDQNYKILLDSEDEDQLYGIVDGRRIFRTEHQVATLLAKVPLAPGARVLDYGCAKASTLRRLAETRPDIEPHVLDVSEMYLPYWRRFVRPENCACYEPKPEWAGRFDLITSFFALEHVAEPRALVATVARLLQPGGHFYCIVPNVYANAADLVVADHINHFSAPSLRRLLHDAGLEVTSLDEHSHTSAWVLVARKQNPAAAAGRPAVASPFADAALPALHAQAREMAAYWRDFADQVRAFEREQAGAAKVAIYGSGFYGTFIATCLRQPEKVVCFLDRNPHRQRQRLLDKPILAPEQLPADIAVVYVGLNPRLARAGIAEVAAWHGKPHHYFFA